jgi:hypothetical protein
MFRRTKIEQIAGSEKPILATDQIDQLSYVYGAVAAATSSSKIEGLSPETMNIDGGLGGGQIDAPSFDRHKFAIALKGVMEARGLS